jgi:NADH-quinone oxidoreductase subunit E
VERQEVAMDIAIVDRIIDEHRADASLLIQVLLDIQSEHHWLPGEALARVSERLQVPMSRIRHVATFYKAFRVVPRARHEVRVCTGTSCHVRGAARVVEAVKDQTGLLPGETDPDLRYSLETVTCLGCCALGPVMVIDGKAHGRLSPSAAADVMKRYE